MRCEAVVTRQSQTMRDKSKRMSTITLQVMVSSEAERTDLHKLCEISEGSLKRSIMLSAE